MSAQTEPTFLLLGLSGTGKTNFLVACDVVLDYQGNLDGLVHSGPSADRTYLQPLRESWLRGEELQHTSRLQAPPPHHLLTSHPPSGRTASFYLPDLAGESFESYFELRGFPEEMVQRVKGAAGLCLFVHSDSNSRRTVMAQADIRELMEPNDDTAGAEQPALKEWQTSDAGDQIKLVDLLQFFFQIREPGTPFDIAVIVSAWDLVERIPVAAARATPEHYFAKGWPLLHQYLHSLPKQTRHRVFGVSARGGGSSEAEIRRLTEEIERPRDRVIVVDGANRSSDISRPLRWMLGLLHESST